MATLMDAGIDSLKECIQDKFSKAGIETIYAELKERDAYGLLDAFYEQIDMSKGEFLQELVYANKYGGKDGTRGFIWNDEINAFYDDHSDALKQLLKDKGFDFSSINQTSDLGRASLEIYARYACGIDLECIEKIQNTMIDFEAEFNEAREIIDNFNEPDFKKLKAFEKFEKLSKAVNGENSPASPETADKIKIFALETQDLKTNLKLKHVENILKSRTSRAQKDKALKELGTLEKRFSRLHSWQRSTIERLKEQYIERRIAR